MCFREDKELSSTGAVILICSGCYTKMPQTGMRGLTQQTLISHVLEAGSPRSRCLQIGCLVGAASGFTDEVFPLGLRMVEGVRELSGVPFIRPLVPLSPSHLPKASPANTITPGFVFQHTDLMGRTRTFRLRGLQGARRVLWSAELGWDASPVTQEIRRLGRVTQLP